MPGRLKVGMERVRVSRQFLPHPDLFALRGKLIGCSPRSFYTLTTSFCWFICVPQWSIIYSEDTSQYPKARAPKGALHDRYRKVNFMVSAQFFTLTSLLAGVVFVFTRILWQSSGAAPICLTLVKQTPAHSAQTARWERD